MNLKVEHAPTVQAVADFRDFVFPIMWLEEVKLLFTTTKPSENFEIFLLMRGEIFKDGRKST